MKKKTRFPLLLAAGYALLLPSLWAADTVVEEIIARVNNEIITRTEYVRSRDQVKQDVQQQDAANAERIFTEKQREHGDVVLCHGACGLDFVNAARNAVEFARVLVREVHLEEGGQGRSLAEFTIGQEPPKLD